MKHKIEALLDIMTQLRNPDGGCPWDLKQTYETIVPYTLEEAYEVAETIEQGDYEHLKDELGDLLFQVVFYAQIAKEESRFEFNDVVDAICEKMIRRHPHVFSDVSVNDETDVKANWEQIKREERQEKSSGNVISALDGVNAALPGLTRAKKLTKRAADVGFDWPDYHGVVDKIHEELDEVQQAIASGDQEHIEEEMGDLFFVVANLARHMKVDPESCVRKANRKFERRFHQMEATATINNRELKELSLNELDDLWEQAKVALKNA